MGRLVACPKDSHLWRQNHGNTAVLTVFRRGLQAKTEAHLGFITGCLILATSARAFSRAIASVSASPKSALSLERCKPTWGPRFAWLPLLSWICAIAAPQRKTAVASAVIVSRFKIRAGEPYWIVSLSVTVLLAVFGSLTPAGTLTLAVFEIMVPELPLMNPVAL
jgi:hypothetical protein